MTDNKMVNIITSDREGATCPGKKTQFYVYLLYLNVIIGFEELLGAQFLGLSAANSLRKIGIYLFIFLSHSGRIKKSGLFICTPEQQRHNHTVGELLLFMI